MSEFSAVEIARRQRHLFLLAKVKENKTLSKAEVDELKRYERRMKSKKPIETGKEKGRKPVSRRRKKKKTAKRKSQLPIIEVEVRRLGLECENLTGADAEIRRQKTEGGEQKRRLRRSLQEYLKRYPELKAAWKRGRFLRNLRDLARTAVSVSEAARKLKLANGQALREMLDNDMEVADIWDQTRLEVFIEAKAALVDAAKDGNQAAIRAVEGLLHDEKEQGGIFDLTHITTAQLLEVTGKSRMTIHDWHTKFGLRRNADKTFDLNEFFIWFEQFVEGKCGKEKTPQSMNPYQARRVQLMDIDIAKQKGHLLDRLEVLAGIAARYQRLVTARRKIGDLAMRCAGKPQERVAEECEAFFDEIIDCQSQDFEELRLPEVAMNKFVEVLALLRKN